SSAITADTELVVFETLYLGNITVLEHKDLDDADQTVLLTAEQVIITTTTYSDVPNTGDDFNAALWLGILGGACVLLGITLFCRRKNSKTKGSEKK
ncbi:MAG: LPXTG cell wall anchor domain-containing protein, partial [Clostridiales bacterium]|nr:LPXTG cell wall anchor domain-containing protein [Clostridiales bacterium]